MAQPGTPPYPTEIALEAYLGGDTGAIARQFLVVCKHYPERAREFAEDAAYAVGGRSCQHQGPPPHLPAGVKGEALVQAAASHVELCGKQQAGIIAAVTTDAVFAKWGTTTGNKFRNQVGVMLGVCSRRG